MSIVRYFLIVILSVIVGFFGLRFYDNYSESTEINTFLEEAYIVSTLHNLKNLDKNILAEELELIAQEKPMELILPCLFSELKSDALTTLR